MNKIVLFYFTILLFGCTSAPQNRTILGGPFNEAFVIHSGCNVGEDEVFPDQDRIFILANSTCFYEINKVIWGYEREAQMKAFSQLYDKKDPTLFEKVFQESKNNSGRAYALLGLRELDQQKYNHYSAQMKPTDKIRYESTQFFVRTITVSNFIKKIKNGELNKKITYLSADQRSLRDLRLLSYLMYIPHNGEVDEDDVITFLAHATEFIIKSKQEQFVKNSIEHDVWRLCFSELIDLNNVKLFEKLYRQSNENAGKMYALLGMSVINFDVYKTYRSKIKGKVFVRNLSSFYLSNEEVSKRANGIWSCFSMVYIPKKNRPSFCKKWASAVLGKEDVQNMPKKNGKIKILYCSDKIDLWSEKNPVPPKS